MWIKRALLLPATLFCACLVLLAPLSGSAAEGTKAEQPAAGASGAAPAAPAASAASAAKPAQPVQPAQPANESFDILLLMDSSGSMKKTDPRNYRIAAARLFISLLGKDDRVGIVSFGDAAKTVLPLTATDPAHRTLLFGAAGKITSSELTTHIHEGVKLGVKELAASTKKNRVLLLMSDGKLALGSKEKEAAALQELSGLIGELAQSGVRLYAIAFTEQSDMALLEDMAKATGGFSRLAVEDKDLHVIFTSIFEKIKSPDTVPLEGDSFAIDKAITEALVLITKTPGTSTTLLDPAGKKYTPAHFARNMQWHEAKLFDMITIAAPAVGRWKVNLSTKEGNKIFVVTDLQLKSTFDKSYVNKGDRLRIAAWLEKDASPLAEPDLLKQVSFSVEVAGPASADGKATRVPLQDTGQGGDEKAGDGAYAGELFIESAGEYTLRLIAEGAAFKREKVFQFKAAEPPAPAAAPQPPAQAGAPPPAAQDEWEPVLVRFGIINGIALLAAAAFYFGARARNTTKTKQKRGKRS